MESGIRKCIERALSSGASRLPKWPLGKPRTPTSRLLKVMPPLLTSLSEIGWIGI